MGAFFGGLRSSSNTKSMDVYLVQPSRNTTVAKGEKSSYSLKVVWALTEVLSRVLEGTDQERDDLEMKAWRVLRAKAKKIV